eukprot:TRINITY_DN590_c3_g2_i1.p1 TRINITY_DN590_c3_g2~~TRINITY_DN590_c3_g2_i1.p1  ORF type:complete len:657 (-),score=166.19 TRINITY_DN590_c3_g2_i1:44-2014(-)
MSAPRSDNQFSRTTNPSQSGRGWNDRDRRKGGNGGRRRENNSGRGGGGSSSSPGRSSGEGSGYRDRPRDIIKPESIMKHDIKIAKPPQQVSLLGTNTQSPSSPSGPSILLQSSPTQPSPSPVSIAKPPTVQILASKPVTKIEPTIPTPVVLASPGDRKPTIARPPSTNPSSVEENLSKSSKIINENGHFLTENGAKLLSGDNKSYLVVSVIGTQGVGKSTIASLLYGSSGDESPFSTQSRENQLTGQHCTIGADMAVSRERMIIIDTHPLFSASCLIDMARSNSSLPSECVSYEHYHELQCLQLCIFVLSISHVVLVVQDGNYVDWKLWHFLQTAAMLKSRFPDPSSPELTGSAQANTAITQRQRLRNQLDKIKSTLDPLDLYHPDIEYFPNLVFLFNKAPAEVMTMNGSLSLQSTLDVFFDHYRFKTSIDFIKPDALENYNYDESRRYKSWGDHDKDDHHHGAKKLRILINADHANDSNLDKFKDNQQGEEEGAGEDDEDDENDDAEYEGEESNSQQSQPRNHHHRLPSEIKNEGKSMHVNFYALPFNYDTHPQNRIADTDLFLTNSYQVNSEYLRNRVLSLLASPTSSTTSIHSEYDHSSQLSKIQYPKFEKQLTERDWFRNSSRLWEIVKRSPIIFDYNKVMQSTNYKTNYYE